MYKVLSCLAVAALVMTAPAQAADVRITQDIEVVEVNINGTNIVIDRIQDTENRLDNDFVKTSRKCPPFCIHPMKAADGVETVGELEIIEFLKAEVEAGTGLLVDARIPRLVRKGRDPGCSEHPVHPAVGR